MYVLVILVLASIVHQEKKRWVWSPLVTLVFWSCPHPQALQCAKIDAKVKGGLYLFHKNTLLEGGKSITCYKKPSTYINEISKETFVS
jgi:hypothetical protein